MDPDSLLRGLSAAADGAGGVRCLRLLRLEPSAFASVRSEVLSLCATRSPSVVSEPGHVTGWVLPYGEVLQYSLFNSTGRTEDFSDDHDLSRPGKTFVARNACPTLGRLVDGLPDLVNVRVAVLGPGAGLSPHQEQVFIRAPNGDVVARVRCHLPVKTASTATLVLDDQVLHLEEGVVHLVNHGCVHAARNDGDEPRVHVLWDQVLTTDAFAFLMGRRPTADPWLAIPPDEQVAQPVTRVRVSAARRLPRRVRDEEIREVRLARDRWWQGDHGAR